MAEPAPETVAPQPIVIRSRRFGIYEVPASRVITFAAGLIGFPDLHRFALLETARPRSPFRFLISVDLPEIAFVVCNPQEFWPDYAAEVPAPGDPHGELAVLVMVTVPANPHDMTANLMAPLVIDSESRRGAQIVIDTGRYSTRHPLLSAGGVAPSAAAQGGSDSSAG
jgi:flagellar assembly factor FliW